MDVAADLEAESTRPSPPTADKSQAKVSCLACRAAKRKCRTPNEFTTCERCTIHHLNCEYKKHRRGRIKKNINGPAATAPTVTGQETSAQPDTNESASRMAIGAGVDGFARSQTAASGSSRVEIQFSHVVPFEGDSSPYLPRAGNTLPQPTPGLPTQPQTPLEQLVRPDCPDPVTAGVLTESDALQLFDFYFSHLNITVAILDPVLHTASHCRNRSPLLFTAVLTVTSKIIRPKSYSNCLLLSNRLVGQAVEFGLCAVEIVQALNLLTQWKKADDATSWRRVGYAIRMAQELKLNVKAARPLPRNEGQARELLNRERAWLNLIVADYQYDPPFAFLALFSSHHDVLLVYSLAIHHTLPRMISDESIDDPEEWVYEHADTPCPGESALGPMITFSRMCRLYADMLAGMNGDHSNLRLLIWIELEWKRWRSRWLENNNKLHFLQQQMSLFKICDALFRFHICEYRLLFTARYRVSGQALDTTQPTELSFAFSECADAALALATVFQNDIVEHGYVPYCFNLVWVALAVTSVWLVKNIVPMTPTDRAQVIRTLSDIQFATEEASCSSDDMAAYTHRLLKHLLVGISPEWQFASILTQTQTHQNRPRHATTVLTRSPSNSSAAIWAPSSAQEVIQEQLWSQHQHGYPPMSGATDMNGQSFYPQGIQGSLMSGGVGMTTSSLFEDLLFPPDDDDFWKVIFPLTDASVL